MAQRVKEEPLEELESDQGQLGPESGGQSGDTQGLSEVAEADGESVEELVDSGQDYEAEVIEGVEDAGDHPEKPLQTRENQSRPPELPPLRRD